MFNKNIDYTIRSNDPDHYNRITENLVAPPTFLSQMVVTGLTSKCSIVVLDEGDYITINNKQYTFKEAYTDLNVESFRDLLFILIKDDGYNIVIDNAQRIVITKKEEFSVLGFSYNVGLLCGYYNTKLPIVSVQNGTGNWEIKSESVGYYLSTPILYLVSNIGTHCYRTGDKRDNGLTGSKILMRINNSYSANYPIVASNGDFATEVLSNDLSDARFTLVDANMHEIKLLCPIYISINITSVPNVIDETFSGEWEQK